MRRCMAHLFVARNASRVAEANADDLEEQQLLHLSRSEVETALAAGEFKVLAWAAAVALALRYLEERAQTELSRRRIPVQ